MPIVEKNTLVEALRRVSLAVTDKAGTYSPDSIQSDGESLYGFNEVIGVLIKAPWLKGTRFSVHGPTFAKAARAADGAEVAISIDDGFLVVKGAKIKTKIKILEDRVKERYENIFPFEPDWVEFPNVAELVKPLIIRSSFKFSGNYFHGEAAYVAESRFALRTLIDANMPELWLSTQHVLAVSQFGPTDGLIVRSSWAHFSSGQDIISVRRLLEVNYPNKVVKALFVAESAPALEITLTEELVRAIRTSIPFAESAEEGAMEGTLIFTKDSIRVTTGAKGSSFEEVIPTQCPVDEPVSISLDLKALARCVRYMTEGHLALIEGKRKRLLLRGDNVEGAVSVE